MTRCPNTHRPIQWRGKKKYALAGRTLQCVREAGHGGPCAWEPVGSSVTFPLDIPGLNALDQAMNGRPEPKPQTPEQIAAGDARYREMLLRRRRG